MNESAIGWTNRTWNFVHGCYKKSDGCKFCYAMTLSLKRGWTKEAWTLQNAAANIQLKPHKLNEPYTLKESQRIFVNSMSDLGLAEIPDWYKAAGYAIMCDTPQHIYQILTKRPEDYIDWPERFAIAVQSPEFADFTAKFPTNGTYNRKVIAALKRAQNGDFPTPFAANVWIGTSVEDARQLHRIKSLQAAPGVVRFISAEPLIGAWGNDVDLSGIHWLIVGGESGGHLKDPANAHRWLRQEWAREIRDMCVAQGVAYFMKQDSALVTETRKYLVESDGSKVVWNQYPGQFTPPTIYGTDEIYAPYRDYEWKSSPPVEPLINPKSLPPAESVTVTTLTQGRLF